MRRILSAGLVALLVAGLLPLPAFATAAPPARQAVSTPSGPATQLSVVATTPQAAGTSFSVTVTAQDAGASTDTGYVGTVHLTSSDLSAILPADYTFTPGDAGAHVFDVTLDTAGLQSITVTDTVDNTISGTQGSIDVAAGAGTKLVVTTEPSSAATAGASISPAPVVAIEDALGNIVTGDSATFVDIALTSAGGAVLSGTTHVQVSAGVATFGGLSIDKTGTYSLTASTTGLADGVTGSIDVSASAATHLSVSAATSQAAGQAFSVTITALDQFDNVATGYAGTVHLTSSDGAAVLPGDYTFVPGTDLGAKSLGGTTLQTPGTQSITATDTVATSITGAQSGIDVIPGAASKLAIRTQPSGTVTAGVAIGGGPVIQVEDALGNVVTSDSSTVVHIALTTAGGATLSGTLAATAVSGVATFSGLSIDKTGTYTLTATAASLADSPPTTSIQVSAAPASQLVVAGFADPATAGVSSTFTVTALDPFGNVATGYAGAVHFSSSDSSATLPGNHTFTVLDAGTGTFSATLRTAGSRSISAGDGTLAAGQSNIAVDAAAATHLSVNATSPQVRTIAFDVTVTALDPFGNTAAGYGGTVHFTSTDGGANVPTDHAFTVGDAGVHTFILGATFGTAGSWTITATDASTSSITGTTGSISVSATGSTPQTVTFSLPGTAFGAAPFTVTATSTSGLTTFTYSSESLAVCTVSGATVTIVAAGDCTIQAVQPGDSTYAPASKTATFTVARANQTVSFTSTAPVGPKITDTYTPTATATSGAGATISVDAGSASICTISLGTVTFNARGTCVLDAAQGGDTNWNASPTVQQSILVVNVPPTCSGASAAVVMNVVTAGDVACSDFEHDPLTYAVAASASHGTAAVNATTGHWTYAPAANYTGVDSFQVTANDTHDNAVPATISLTVGNLPADAHNDAYWVAPLGGSVLRVLVNDYAGTGGTDAGQPVTITSVTQGTKGQVWTDGTTITYDPNGCATGSDLFTYTISDGVTTATAAVLVVIVRPGQAVTAPAASTMSPYPIADTPYLAFVPGATIGSTIPMRVGWCGITAAGTGVRAYRVYQSTNYGASFASTPISASTASSVIRPLAFGARYGWRVRVTDTAGRNGGYSGVLTDRVVRYEDNGGAIGFSSGWRVIRSSAYSGGAEHFATTPGASAAIRLAGARGFAIVGSRAPGRGSFYVYVDGVRVALVGEGGSSTQRRVLFTLGISPGAVHLITIRSTGRARIDLDAIIALY